jgi:hypothetical protein
MYENFCFLPLFLSLSTQKLILLTLLTLKISTLAIQEKYCKRECYLNPQSGGWGEEGVYVGQCMIFASEISRGLYKIIPKR